MKGIVTKPFRDKYHYNTEYHVGETVDFDEVRMADLFSRNLCKKYEEQEEKPVPHKETKEEKQQKSELEEPLTAELTEKQKSEDEAVAKIAKAIRRAKK